VTGVVVARDLASIDLSARQAQAVFAVARRIEMRRSNKNEPFADLELSDCSASYRCKVWAGAKEALEAVQALAAGSAVKVLFELDSFQGVTQLDIKRLRPVTPQDVDEGYDPVRLFGPAHELVQRLACRTMVFDIETVPTVDLRKAPASIAQAVSKTAERREYDETKVMALSPFFGQVVSLAVGDGERDPRDMPVTVFVVPPPGRPLPPLPEWVVGVSEAELLHAFWGLAALAETVVTFNGQYFDVPYLVARSVVLEVPARVDLTSRIGKTHCDVCALLTQGGRSLQPANLEVVSWALGIESPKGEMDGSRVGQAYAAGEIEKIALYNAADVRATTAIYRRLKATVLPFRSVN
jgi:predicted PolB exonuclease-like 3'-5' exonuclease